MLADSYSARESADATIVIPQDLPLLDAADISMACELAEKEDRCVVITPSLRYDGTNLLLRKPPEVMKTLYDSDSYESHVRTATELGIPVKLFLSKRVMCDVDTPEDARQLAKETGPSGGGTLEFLKSLLK